MLKVFSIILTLIITSFYYFPFTFTFFPIANTKMILAFGGLVILFFKLSTNRNAQISKDLFILSLLALGVSFASLFSITYNSTPDGSYLTYIISMWVWLSAAFFWVCTIKRVHNKVSVELICLYLIAVGVIQCILAICIDQYPFVKSFVNSFLANWKVEGRLYGIGCAVDVGGGRLAVLLIMIAYLLPKMITQRRPKHHIILLIISYIIIATLGNMIARTVTVGLLISIAYIAYALLFNIAKESTKELGRWVSAVFFTAIILFTYLYNNNSYWREQLRFGFEGFFSLAEKGKWDVQSNNMLAEGFIYPDNTKTWLIGDGYMGDPDNDPYYIGADSYGYYMNTDAGYSRFLFYFGIIGLMFFSIFMIKVCQVNIKKFPQYGLMFIMILILNFGIWIKVTTDIFLAMAPFLCISAMENEEYEKRVALEQIND